MVSLRSNFWGLGRSTALAGRILVVIGLVLSAIAIAGTRWHGTSLEESNADPALKRYVAGLRGGAPFDLVSANRTVYLATTHSDDRRIELTENWMQWALGKIYPPLARTQNAERLMAGRFANCSERSEILKSLCEEAGQRCRFVGLSGHVVLEVETPDGWKVADPDYGVVYPLGIETLQRPDAAPPIRQTLAAAGYPPPNIDLYLRIVQSPDDNVVLPVGSPLSPRLDAVERWCDRLELPLPLGLIAAGVVLLCAAKFARNGRPQQPGLVSQAACESGLRPRPA